MKRTYFDSANAKKNDRNPTRTRHELTLHRETLRHLMGDELGLAAGGVAQPPASGARTCVGDDI